MLSHLVIKNFTIVRDLELELSGGLTIVTGETGAGKSIMLDALALALGDRADPELIGPQGSRAEIIASFDISTIESAQNWLAERDLQASATEVGEEVILRRILNREGRSRAFINGALCNLQDLKAIGEMLIDIHSQHEHQSLLQRESHRLLLDGYAGAVDLADMVEDHFREHRQCLEQLLSRQQTSGELDARVQLLSYQAAELRELAPTEGEYHKLEAEHRQLANAESALQSAGQAIVSLKESDSNIVDQLAHLTHQLQALDDLRLKNTIELIQSSGIQLDEAITDLRTFVDNYENNPQRLAELELRITDLFQMARKHQVEPDKLESRLNFIEEELDQLEANDESIAELQAELAKRQGAWKKTAVKLAKVRRKAAVQMVGEVNHQLSELGMPGARFEVEISPRTDDEPHPSGLDQIEFLISTVNGQPARSLNRIASGGELSRISLAIQVINAATSRVPTLIFDEVDVGVGGAVAEKIGNLLRSLGDIGQILCVTHLPQVAAQGHQHLLVDKSEKPEVEARTTRLNSDGRVAEIARMLGGLEMTPQTLAHAREMFDRAQDPTNGTPRKAV